MKKIKLLVELEYDESIIYGNDQEAMKWFFDEILAKDRLILHSKEIGDEIGEIKLIQIIGG